MSRGARRRRRERRLHLQKPLRTWFFKTLNAVSHFLFGKNIFARWVYPRLPKGTKPNPPYNHPSP